MSDRTVAFSELVSHNLLEVGAGRPRSAGLDRFPLPILRVADVLEGRIQASLQNNTPAIDSQIMGSKISRPGDVVLTAKGTVGRVAIIPSEGPTFAYSPQLCYFRPAVNGPLRPRYLYYWFKSEEFWNQADALKGQTDMADFLSLSDVYSLKMRLPSLDEQLGTVDILGSLDDKIAANDRIIVKARELLAAEFASLQMNDESELASLNELIEINPKVRKPDVEEPVYLDMKNLPDRSMTVTSWGHRTPRGGARFQNGDTLLARITPCLENGKIGYIDFLANGEVGIGSTEFIVMRPRKGIPATFPYFLAIDATFREYAIKRMVGTSGRQRLSAGSIANFQMRRPPEHELARFCEVSDALMDRVKAAVDETRVLAAARDELLPLLMSGKIRVREAEKIVEGVV